MPGSNSNSHYLPALALSSSLQVMRPVRRQATLGMEFATLLFECTHLCTDLVPM